MIKIENKKSGFIKSIILIVGALVLLKYAFNLDVVGYLTQGRFKELLDRFYELGSVGWQKYKDIFMKGWNNALELIKTIITNIKK